MGSNIKVFLNNEERDAKTQKLPAKKVLE